MVENTIWHGRIYRGFLFHSKIGHDQRKRGSGFHKLVTIVVFRRFSSRSHGHNIILISMSWHKMEEITPKRGVGMGTPPPNKKEMFRNLAGQSVGFEVKLTVSSLYCEFCDAKKSAV